MAIEIRPSGEPGAIAQAGLAVGQAERAKEERARADRAAEQAAQDRARRVAQDLEIQKMMFNSQQEFAHEQRLRQVELDKEARSYEWEKEKMELRSQMDFQQEEKDRLKNIESVTNQISTLDKYKDQLDSRQYTEKMFELQTALDNAKAGGNITSGRLPTPEKESTSPVLAKRKVLEAWFGEEAKVSSISDMEQQLKENGIDPESLYSSKEMVPQKSGIEQFATNPQTGKTIVSYDGGDTWEPLTKETPVVEQPVVPKEPVREWGSNAPAWTQKKWPEIFSYLYQPTKNKTFYR